MIRESITQTIRERGVKQVDMCRDLKLEVANVNAFLHGKRTLPFQDLCLVMRYLGVSFGMRNRNETNWPPAAVHKLASAIISGRGIKTSDLAKMSGISASSVSSFITGERPLSLNNLETMCRFLNIGITKYTK